MKYIERWSKEVERRSDIVGVVSAHLILRLIDALLFEQNDGPKPSSGFMTAVPLAWIDTEGLKSIGS